MIIFGVFPKNNTASTPLPVEMSREFKVVMLWAAGKADMIPAQGAAHQPMHGGVVKQDSGVENAPESLDKRFSFPHSQLSSDFRAKPARITIGKTCFP